MIVPLSCEVIFFLDLSFQMSGFPCVVKVNNISKQAQERDIQARIDSTAAIFCHISVIKCRSARVNYAYVNCSDLGSAQLVVYSLNQTTLFGNKLTAKILTDVRSDSAPLGLHSASYYRSIPTSHQDYYSPSSPAYAICEEKEEEEEGEEPGHCSKKRKTTNQAVQDYYEKEAAREQCSLNSKSTNGSRTIKVSFHSKILTGADIDKYFGDYGKLTSNTIIRQGEPYYAYVNFASESAALAASSITHHHINSILVTASIKSSLPRAPSKPSLSIPSLSNIALPCNPLVIGEAKEAMIAHFPENEILKVLSLEDKFIIHVHEKIAEFASKVFRKIIAESESKITTRKIPLSICYFPLLANQKVIRKLAQISSKFHLKIECSGDSFSLEQFQNDWKKTQIELSANLSSSSTQSKFQWYWFNDDKYLPYSSKVNECIESAFQRNASTEMSIGAHNYTINTTKKWQVNKATTKVRKIQRKELHSVMDTSNTYLYLTAHDGHIKDTEKAIFELLDSSIREVKIPLSDAIWSHRDSVDRIITSATTKIVNAFIDEDEKCIVIQGAGSRVDHSRKEAQISILAKERELGRAERTKFPSTWTPQVQNCELKTVPRESSEWEYVEKKFLQSNSIGKIVEIERIQNKWLWEAYTQAEDRMMVKNGEATTKMLFHGTRCISPKEIYKSEQGFDNRMASKGLYGEGTYFASTSSYSHDYAHGLSNGHKQMFLVKVLTGVSCLLRQRDTSLKVPPPKLSSESAMDFEMERYDSVRAYSGSTKIYVIYELNRSYPTYLITYNDS